MFEFTPRHQYLVGIHSDGRAFGTMELKHKECFGRPPSKVVEA